MKTMRVVAVTGHKGGTGKSKTTENLGVEAAERGERVVILDLDPQCTTSKWGDRREPDPERRENANPAVLSVQYARLGPVLDVARRQGTTFAIIDTPPKNSDAALAALKHADIALLPLRPEIEDLETLPDVRQLLMLGGDPPAFVLLTQCPAQGAYEVEAAATVRDEGFAVCPVTIYTRRDYANASVPGKAVTEYAPKGKAAQEVRALYEFVRKQLNSRKAQQHGERTRIAQRA